MALPGEVTTSAAEVANALRTILDFGMGLSSRKSAQVDPSGTKKHPKTTLGDSSRVACG